MGASTRVMHSIISCRILLNLKEATAPEGGSLAEVSTGLAFAHSIGQQTNQPETIRLEGYQTGSREEGHCHGT